MSEPIFLTVEEASAAADALSLAADADFLAVLQEAKIDLPAVAARDLEAAITNRRRLKGIEVNLRARIKAHGKGDAP